jgi:ComEC/Rec2-related protein
MVFSAAFLGGLVAARAHVYVPLWFAVSLGIISFSLLKRPVFHLILVLMCGLTLGIWRGGEYLQRLQPYKTYEKQAVTLRATADIDAVYGDRAQLEFTVRDVQFLEPKLVKAPGKIKIKGFGELAVYKGDVLEISGKLYPTRGANQASMGYAKIRRVDSHNSIFDVIRRKFVAGMQTALPEPVASFGLGLLVGQRNTLPYETSQALLMVGLTHIVAVSGYNLTILLDAARRVIGNRSKLLSVVVGLALMGMFLLFTGGSASIVRASIVSTLSLAAWYYGRRVRPLLLVLGPAALTAYANPVYVWSDIGWYLSFLAFFGILMIAPKVLELLSPGRQPPLLVQVAVETFAAELMTIPLILYIFGQVSFVGLLANVLVVSMIPLAMLLCLLAGIAGIALPMLAGLIALPARYLLTYMIDTALVLSRVPKVFHSGVYISAVDLSICYLGVAAVTYLLNKPKDLWFRSVTTYRQNNE